MYLRSIQFICLAMTETYIDTHFQTIKKYGSIIESRLDDTDCTMETIKLENRMYIEGYKESGEQVICIDSDYEKTIEALLQEEIRKDRE